MKRLPSDITAERLIRHYEQYSYLFNGREKDSYFTVVNNLFEISELERQRLGRPYQPLTVWE